MAKLEIEVPPEIIEKVTEYILGTPKLLGGLFCSYFMGHIFVYLTIAHLKKNVRGNKILDSKAGKISLGCCWICLISLPIYWLKFDNLGLEYSNFLEILPTVIIFSFACQLVVYLIIAKYWSN